MCLKQLLPVQPSACALPTAKSAAGCLQVSLLMTTCLTLYSGQLQVMDLVSELMS